MASHHVAGLASLVWATAYGSDNISVRSHIEGMADKVTVGNIYSKYSILRINAYSAVA